MLTDDESKPETDPIIGALFCAPVFAPLSRAQWLLYREVSFRIPRCVGDVMDEDTFGIVFDSGLIGKISHSSTINPMVGRVNTR